MEAYELAEEIRKNGEKKFENEDSQHLSKLIDHVKYELKQSPELQLSKLEESESGYAYIELSKEIYNVRRPEHCVESSIVVHYFDKIQGKDYSLGCIWQIPGQRDFGAAGYYEYEREAYGHGPGKKIYPEDEEWDAVVGTVERAIQTVQERRLAKKGV